MDKTKLPKLELEKQLNNFHETLKNTIIPSLHHDNIFGPHPEGLSLYNLKKKICVLLTPKNASTSLVLSTMFYSIKPDWMFCNFLKQPTLEIDKFVVICRDPANRFLSATNMFLTKGSPMRKTFVLNNKIFTEDCHFTPQVEFIRRVPRDKTDFFYFKNSVLNDISDFYDVEMREIGHHNKTRKLVTSVDEDFIKTIYAKDYELISSVKFVNKP